MTYKMKIFLGSLFTFLILWIVGPFTGIDDYTASVKEKTAESPVFQEIGKVATAEPEQEKTEPLPGRKEWIDRIRLEAVKLRIEPINAKLDRIWKAIPGYNGLEVDEAKTLELIKKTAKLSDPISFVYKEIQPQINLQDLAISPIYKGNPHKPMVSLMINVAWGNEFLPMMLEILKKESVHATFFFDGSWLSKNIETAKLIGTQGHELSNHAFSHKNMSKLSRQAAMDEIVKTEQLLVKELGVHNTLFAPPSGDFKQETVEIAHELQLQTILWTLDTVDWSNPTPESILQKISTKLEPGSLILMHPTRSSSLALEAMIKEIKRKGLLLGTVSELLSTNRVPGIHSLP